MTFTPGCGRLDHAGPTPALDYMRASRLIAARRMLRTASERQPPRGLEPRRRPASRSKSAHGASSRVVCVSDDWRPIASGRDRSLSVADKDLERPPLAWTVRARGELVAGEDRPGAGGVKDPRSVDCQRLVGLQHGALIVVGKVTVLVLWRAGAGECVVECDRF